MKRFVFSFLLLATAFIAKAQTADEIIAKHIEAIGGADAWKKVNSVKMEGTMLVQGATVTMTQTVITWKRKPPGYFIGGYEWFYDYSTNQWLELLCLFKDKLHQKPLDS